MRRLRAQEGMTLVEVLVAMMLLTIGIVSLISAFDGARKLTLVAERRASIAHLAQRELERLQSVPYSELAMATAPAKSAESTNPDYYVDYASPSPLKCEEAEKGGCFAWNAEQPTEEEPLVISKLGKKCPTTGTEEGCGVISASPTGVACSEVNPFGACEWTDGRLSGAVYDFVTYHKDTTGCKEVAKCTASATAYKRVTVVVTVNVPTGSHPVTPVRVSSLIPNPTAAKESPLSSPGTKCDEKSCLSGLSNGTAHSWFLHDVSAEAAEKEGLEAAEKTVVKAAELSSEHGHKTDNTVGPAPAQPDFMDSTKPERKALYDYSTDQNMAGTTLGLLQDGGRRIAQDVGCGSEAELEAKPPTSSNQWAGELWITAPLASEYKLNGEGGLTFFTQTISSKTNVSVTLCVGVYDVPEKIDKLWSTAETSPKLIGFASYAANPWPTALTSVSFTFSLQFIKGNKAIAEKHRLGFRIWPSNEPIAATYDTELQTATLQLNTE